MLTCNKCSENISKTRYPGVKCGGACKKTFHVKCVKISNELLRDINNRAVNWLCELCRDASEHSVIDSDISEDNISLADIMRQLKIMEKKLSSLDELKNNVSTLQQANCALNKRVNKLEEQLVSYHSKLHALDAIIDKPNQIQNAACIAICGLPMLHGDSRGVIVNTINKLEESFNADDIESIETVHRPTSPLQTNTKKSFLNDFFIVKLKSISMKNIILEKMRKRKTLSTNDLDVILPHNHPQQRVYVMHHLTRFQSQLYREAKNIKVKYNYKYLWCKAGQIYLRKSAGSDVHRIHSMNDIFLLRSNENPLDEDETIS